MNLPNDPTAVILDPHPLWLDAVERVLDGIGIRVAAKATTPDEAFGAVVEHQPDLFVAELGFPGDRLGSIPCVKRVREEFGDVRVIVLSAFEDQLSIESALAAGAAAYVVKTAHPHDLATAIRQVFDPSLYLAGGKIGRRSLLSAANGENGIRELTRREHEILRLVAQGHSNSELAKMLWITEQTIKFHLSNIYRKLDVANRTEAARWAQVQGLLDETAMPPQPWGAGPDLVAGQSR
jgi:DNA-binding NarL/FixJ family response regulator